MADLKLLRWRRDPLGGLYTADEGWTIERVTQAGVRGGRITSWQVRRYSVILADTYGLNAAKQWVQVERGRGSPMTATVTEATRAPLHDFVIHVPGEGILHRTASTPRRARELAGVKADRSSAVKPYVHRASGRCAVCALALAEATDRAVNS